MEGKSILPKTGGGQQDLQKAINALLMSVKIIYFNFQIVFKIIGLAVLGLIAYKLGRLSVSEMIAKKVKNIEKNIQQVQEQKEGLPSRIKKVSSFYFKLIVLFIVLAGAAGGLLYTQQVKLDIVYLAPFIIAPILLYVIKVIHVSNLTTKSKKFGQKEKQIKQKIKDINKELGTKVQNSLRNTLCRDKLISKQNAPSHICNKKECQQYRELLRTKYEVIRNLAECALQFEWCSTCKSRKPFDEMVKFEAKPMPVKDGDLTEQEDADIKINYLLETLEEIDKWIQDAGPCNCSKLYMEEILKNRKNTNRVLKQINAKIQQHNKLRQAAQTVTRTDSRMSATSYTSSISSVGSAQAMTSSGRVYYVNKKQ